MLPEATAARKPPRGRSAKKKPRSELRGSRV